MWFVVWMIIVIIVLATVLILCIDHRRNSNSETEHLMRSGQDVENERSVSHFENKPLATSATSTESKAEVVTSAQPVHESENEIELKSIKRIEEKRQEVAKDVELRRLDLYSSAYSASKNPEEFDPNVDLSSDLFIGPSVFDNQAATAIANMPGEGAELLALTGATNEEEIIPQHTRPEALSPVSNWSKNEEEKIADLEKFDKKDKKTTALIEKVIEISEGEFEPKTLFKIHKEIAPSQSRLMLQTEQN